MFYHYPSTHSSLLNPSFLGRLDRPLVYVFEPRTDKESEAIVKGSDTLADIHGGDDKVSATYRASNMYIEDTKDKYTISFDAPGVKAKDVKLQVADSVLHVSCERKAGDKTINRLEQHFALDESIVDVEKLSANLVDGVLTITAIKKEEPAPLQIAVAPTDPPAPEEGGLFLTLDTPGIKASDIKIDFHKGTLNILGERARLDLQGKRHVVSRLNRVFQIKEKLVDTTKMQAFLCDGVLTVIAPPKPAVPAKKIEIPATSGENETHKEKHETEQIVVETVTKDDEQ